MSISDLTGSMLVGSNTNAHDLHQIQIELSHVHDGEHDHMHRLYEQWGIDLAIVFPTWPS
jgi:hypothetical protein